MHRTSWSGPTTVRAPSNISNGDVSGAERQPNGNTLICYGTHGMLEEVSPTAQKIPCMVLNSTDRSRGSLAQTEPPTPAAPSAATSPDLWLPCPRRVHRQRRDANNRRVQTGILLIAHEKRMWVYLDIRVSDPVIV